MLKPEEVEAMLGLYQLGWGTKRIAREFGCSRNTVKRYVEAQGWVADGARGGTASWPVWTSGSRALLPAPRQTPRSCARI